MDYANIKIIHVASVVASYLLFVVRGVWMMRASPMLTRRWVKVVPHAVDTILLLSAIVLAVRLRQYPFYADWLTAKVVGLAIYIGLGSLALKYGGSMRTRVAGWIAAHLVFFYIVSVALTHDPLPFRARIDCCGVTA